MLTRSPNRVLNYMQPTVARVGFPVGVVGPRTPDRDTIKTDQQVVIAVPNLSKASFDVGDISDKPLGRRVDNTVAWQNAAMHSGRRPTCRLRGGRFQYPILPGSPKAKTRYG